MGFVFVVINQEEEADEVTEFTGEIGEWVGGFVSR